MKNTRKILWRLLYLGILIISCLAGFLIGSRVSGKSMESLENVPSERKLLISVTTDYDTHFTTIAPDVLGGNYHEPLTYNNLSSVTILSNGENIPLENAIRDGYVSVEELFAYARIDARNKICRVTSESTHGLSRFTYTYPEFDISFVYDIYETPDGKTHLIDDVSLYPAGGHRNVTHSYRDDTSVHLYALDREDWGLTFEIADATATGISISCTQSNGQQLGQLQAQNGVIVSNESGEFYDPVIEYSTENGIDSFQPIQTNETTTLNLNWESSISELPSGSYTIRLYICDIYNEEEVHPLMQNFYDMQIYDIEFTVP